MFDYLEQLRKKPVAYRRRVVAFSSISLTALIVLVWLSTISFRADQISDSKVVKDELKPFQEIKDSIGAFYTSLTEAGTRLFSPSNATSTSVDLYRKM